ncbi:MAG: multiubiquitin domain-containing protein [bacterium]|nr:multiubiquitin domain-containing protein [bacterium]
MKEMADNKAEQNKEKGTPIVVNGRWFKVPGELITYEEVVQLAFEVPPVGEYIVYTVTYRGGSRPKPEGSLAPGQSIKVRPEMVFNVTATDKS